MSSKSLLAFVFLVIAGELANAQCPPRTRLPCQPHKPVSTNCYTQCLPVIVHPTCGTPHNSVVFYNPVAVSNSRIVGGTAISSVYYPTPDVVVRSSVGCGSCAVQGYAIVGTNSVPTVPTPIAESTVKPASSKCACTLREIASDSHANGREMNSIVERPNSTPQSPFSEVGHVRPDSGRAVPSVCEIEFLECCAAGGTNCAARYANCADITGEKVKYATCPEEEPFARPKTDTTKKADTSDSSDKGIK